MILWRPSSNAVRFAYSAVSNEDEEEIQQKANENFGEGGVDKERDTVLYLCVTGDIVNRDCRHVCTSTGKWL